MIANFTPGVSHFHSTIDGDWELVGRTSYRVIIDHGNKIIHVTGQHSRAGAEWFDNLDMRTRDFVNDPDLHKRRKEAWENTDEQWFDGKPDIRVHAGFLRQYKAIRNVLLDTCYQYEDYKIFVDGFSLGAGWTQIFMQDILHRWPDRDIRYVGYAPPNPWRRLPEMYQRLLKQHCTFVVPYWDPVTWMRLLRFRRFGKEVRVGRPWRMVPKQHRPDQIIRGLIERGLS